MMLKLPLILSFLKSHWRTVSLVLMVLSIVGLVYGAYTMIDTNGYNRGIKDCNAQKQETIDENIEIRKKQDKVVPFSGKRDFIAGLREGNAL
jgi:hypothetical protein